MWVSWLLKHLPRRAGSQVLGATLSLGCSPSVPGPQARLSCNLCSGEPA